MSGPGDNASGAGGSWTINDNVIVCCDNGTGGDSFISACMEPIQQAGKNVSSGGSGPSSEYNCISGKSNTTVFWCVNGVDRDMCQGFINEYSGDCWKGGGAGDNCNIVVGFLTGSPGICSLAKIQNKNLESAHDAGYASSSLRNQSSGKSVDDILSGQDNCGWVAGPDAASLAQGFLTGAGATSNTGGTGVDIVEGFMTSGRGSSEQVFKTENYEALTEIPFYEVSVTEEDYEVKTAEFKTHEKIDLTSGRVYVLIQGDTGQFGGIILKREYDSQDRMYTYTCQEYMARVMANTVYAIYNESKTVYEWISEIMQDMGIPSYGLDDITAYDNAVDPAYLEEIASEEAAQNELDDDGSTSTTTGTSTDSTGDTTGTEDTTTGATSGSSTADGTSSSTLEEEDDGTVTTNPFEKKPRGIYDKQTILDHFRTLLFDYGVHVRLYGDVVGAPIFKAYEKDEWMNTGWYLQRELGYKSDYKQEFDITDIVTQVGVKNIEALKPTGELYTSEELLGTNISAYFGRIGALVDNPTAQGGITPNEGTGEEFQDADGNKYSADQVLVSHSFPSCKQDTDYNDGYKPEYTTYTKYWYNCCPVCGEEGTCSSYSANTEKGGSEGVIICDRTVRKPTSTATATAGTTTTDTDTSTDTSPTSIRPLDDTSSEGDDSTDQGNTSTGTTQTTTAGATEYTDEYVTGCGATMCAFCGGGLIEVFRIEVVEDDTEEEEDASNTTTTTTISNGAVTEDQT